MLRAFDYLSTYYASSLSQVRSTTNLKAFAWVNRDCIYYLERGISLPAPRQSRWVTVTHEILRGSGVGVRCFNYLTNDHGLNHAHPRSWSFLPLSFVQQEKRTSILPPTFLFVLIMIWAESDHQPTDSFPCLDVKIGLSRDLSPKYLLLLLLWGDVFMYSWRLVRDFNSIESTPLLFFPINVR